MTSELFRKEALLASTDSRFGDHLFHQPLTVRVMVTSVALIFLSFALFGALVQMKQTQLVRGYLTPVGGEVKVFSDRPGVLREVHFKEGERVKKGDVLATVIVNRFDEYGLLSNDIIIDRVNQQIAQLQERMNALKERSQIAEKQTQTRIDGLREELALLHEEHEAVLKRLSLAEQDYNSSVALLERKSISSREHNQSASTLYSLLQLSANTRLQIEGKKLALDESRQQLTMQPLTLQEEQLSLQGTLLQLLARRDELALQGLFTITAPVDGSISNLVSRVGDTTDPGVPYATLIPVDSILEAWLYLPSRAVGDVEIGQDIMLSYDAYPYQTHGTFAATIVSISTAVMDPREFLIPLQLSEPVYRVHARIARQDAGEMRLRSGLQFSAEIITGSESILERLLSPLTSLGRKL